MGGEYNTHEAEMRKAPIGKDEFKGPGGRPKCKVQNTKLDLKGMMCENVDCIHVLVTNDRT
jgi:hypothetical protein